MSAYAKDRYGNWFGYILWIVPTVGGKWYVNTLFGGKFIAEELYGANEA
jgi:hypothetical protein